MKKDELISGAELAKRLNVSAPYITKNKKKLKEAKCIYGKKFYYRKSAQYLGKDPDNPGDSIKSLIQKENIQESNEVIKKPSKETSEQDIESFAEDIDENLSGDASDAEIKTLLHQIEDIIKDPKANLKTVELNGLKNKAALINEYYKGKREKIKYIKEANNLYEKEDVVKILGALANQVRNTLINLPNNYAVNLEGMSQKQIKDYVTDDINKLLEQIQSTGEQFE